MSEMREELEEAEIENYEQRPFIPHDALKDLLPESKIATLISALAGRGVLEVYQQREIINAILDNGLRLFATLLSLSRPELILKFIETDHFAQSQLDSRLPLSHHSLGLILRDEKLSARFYKHQWKFLAPFFRADQSHRELEDNVILPFIDCKRLGEGGFGEVHQMTMVASYQGLVPEVKGQVKIIRKQIKPKRGAEKDFQKEQHILSLLRCLQHPNIIQLLTAYTIHQTHNFLFPLADGDLKDFLCQQRRPPGFETDNNVLQALYELASAIEAVHDYFSNTFNVRKIGCHYDLKPDNILYRSGKFILSDFGLSQLSDENEGSKSLYRNGGGEYWAPECVSIHDDFKKLHVGRSSDMWSFGCILSELLTYLQDGPTGVLNFSKGREITLAGYWTCKSFHGGDKPHEGVSQWLSRLGGRHKITDAQKSLNLLIQDLLQQEPTARPKAQDITLGLFYIAQNEVYQSVDVQFRPLLAKSELEIDIEYERFRIWGEVDGYQDLAQNGQLYGRKEPRNFGDLQLVRRYLARLSQEVENVARVLQGGGRRPYRVLYHLQKVVDELWDMQPSLIRQSMANSLENRILNTEDRARLKSIETAFPGPDAHTSKELSIGDHAPRAVTYRRIGLLAAMKQIASALEDRIQSSANMLIDERQISKPLKPFHWHNTGILRTADGSEKPILIEWLEYGGEWAERMEELIQRIQDIASFRAPSSTRLAFSVLICAGYYHDLAKHAFGIVYYFPPPQPTSPLSSQDVEKPISLRDILSTVRSRKQRPSLDQVFDAALSLINMVLTMHKASWLHKNISSYNIIFFPDRAKPIAEAMTSPHFIGFSYSRLNLENAFTQGPNQQLEYQHPDYLRGPNRFCQEYEYYSVGLVLLELGFWAPLETISKGIVGSPSEMLQALVKTHVPVLKTYMGRAYGDAVAACLSSDFGDSSNPTQVRETFEQKVLLKVENRSH
ncbi:hypothetical protein HO173_005767 [Letharia columbiana]|uniref:Protein kinase domain-containing protein n=1 Tax=Letharia columbiana TaxID=112416 RepID=A0A8H6FWQ0_9LECA|nr:uncharacterized protein HO173_005767 [Letharia columbiana]KAF6236138.1 hypothetical protein HO173_005767 [Letharia columbiana]